MTDSSKPEAKNNRIGKGVPGLLLVLVLCLIGLGVSVELTRIHYFSHTDPSYQSICAVNDRVNCETVAQSPTSVFLNVPVSIWGLLGYGMIAVLAAWGLWGRRLHPHWPWGALMMTIGASTVASALLAYISLTLIDAICIFCTILYAVNLGLLGIVIFHLVTNRVGPFQALRADLKGAFSRPVKVAVFGIVGAGVALALVIWFPPYWHHPGWSDLPDLATGTTGEGLHWIGAQDPVLTVVEFSDYQCPHCRRAHKNARMVTAKFKDSVRLAHRHLPLDSACNTAVTKKFHERACEFSKAAECAGEQGAFWKMNDALFSIQERTKTSDVDVERIAVQLGLDRSSLNQCLKSPGVLKRIHLDLKAAKEKQITGTPTYFIGSKPYPGNIPEKALETAIRKVKAKRREHAKK
jgi:uncharacterized membrane protein/predicted DsbA family dithiol-disulfide isomerase